MWHIWVLLPIQSYTKLGVSRPALCRLASVLLFARWPRAGRRLSFAGAIITNRALYYPYFRISSISSLKQVGGKIANVIKRGEPSKKPYTMSCNIIYYNIKVRQPLLVMGRPGCEKLWIVQRTCRDPPERHPNNQMAKFPFAPGGPQNGIPTIKWQSSLLHGGPQRPPDVPIGRPEAPIGPPWWVPNSGIDFEVELNPKMYQKRNPKSS